MSISVPEIFLGNTTYGVLVRRTHQYISKGVWTRCVFTQTYSDDDTGCDVGNNRIYAQVDGPHIAAWYHRANFKYGAGNGYSRFRVNNVWQAGHSFNYQGFLYYQNLRSGGLVSQMYLNKGDYVDCWYQYTGDTISDGGMRIGNYGSGTAGKQPMYFTLIPINKATSLLTP